MPPTVMSPSALVDALQLGPVEFTQVIATIDQYYEVTPVAFQNGEVSNEAGTNLGSCKILAFAQLHQLSETATLNAFGAFYTDDVLKHPDGNDHQNIRNFIKYGWQGVRFSAPALVAK